MVLIRPNSPTAWTKKPRTIQNLRLSPVRSVAASENSKKSKAKMVTASTCIAQTFSTVAAQPRAADRPPKQPRTGDPGALNVAFRQRSATVRAGVADGMVSSLHVEEAIFWPSIIKDVLAMQDGGSFGRQVKVQLRKGALDLAVTVIALFVMRLVFLAFLALTFFIAKTQQQRFKLTKCLLLVGADRLEDDTVAAIQIGGKQFQYAGGREILLAFANRDCALEPDHAPDKLRCRSRVQPELVDNFEFFTHGIQSGVPCRAI